MAILEAPEHEVEVGAQPPSAPCSRAALGQAAGRRGILPDQPARMDLGAGAASGDSSSDEDEVTPCRCSDPNRRVTPRRCSDPDRRILGRGM